MYNSWVKEYICTFTFDKYRQSAPPTVVVPVYSPTSDACDGLFPQTLAKQNIIQHSDLCQSDRENGIFIILLVISLVLNEVEYCFICLRAIFFSFTVERISCSLPIFLLDFWPPAYSFVLCISVIHLLPVIYVANIFVQVGILFDTVGIYFCYAEL